MGWVAGKGGMEKARRIVRTVYFMVVMVASLLVQSAAVLVHACEVLQLHLQRYGFKSSLMDIPLVSIIRSLIILCVYSICDGPALSHGPYLGTVTLCSIASVLLLSVKAFVFTVNSQLEAEASFYQTRQRLHLKRSWGMPVLFLSSVVFALGHTVIAYRTSCRARRKLLFHRDTEAVLSCKIVLSVYHKVPRSPTPSPSSGRTLRSGKEMKRKPGVLARNDVEVPARVLADINSLFMSCRGLILHYKLSMPGSPSRALSSITFLDRPTVKVPSKDQYHLRRSFSNQFSSFIYTPLLDGSPTSPVLSEDIPIMSLDDTVDDDEGSKLGPSLL